MPTLFEFLGYRIYFWSNEGNEPVHVHVAKRKQTANATKIWLPPESNPVVVHNHSRIPKKDLDRILKFLAQNRDNIISRWYNYFNREEKF